MKTLWQNITAKLQLDRLIEANVHPHVPEEHAELFHAHDDGATEFEYLNLLYALVLATKPLRVIETGTFTGLGTLAIASALEWNERGQIVTLDIDPCEKAKEFVKQFGLTSRVMFVQQDATEFIDSYVGESFDFAFIDSGSQRLEEANALHSQRLLNAGAPVVLHDASPLRHKSMPWAVGPTNAEVFDENCTLGIGHTLPFSRGLRLMFAP